MSSRSPPSYHETRPPTCLNDARPQSDPRLSTSRSTSSGGTSEPRLRFSVQTLDGHVCDDEDEDSETDDGESETDEEEQSTDEDGANSAGINRRPRRTRRGMRRESEVRGGGKANVKQAELDEVYYQRKEELASVLRRLRSAIRRMDGVLTEYEVPVPHSRINSCRIAQWRNLFKLFIDGAGGRSMLPLIFRFPVHSLVVPLFGGRG